MTALYYYRRAVLDCISHDFTKVIQEIWVQQPDNKNFVFNSEGGIFFCKGPLVEGNGEKKEIEVDEREVEVLRRYLDVREDLKSKLFKK
jgi:hypothetical protein